MGLKRCGPDRPALFLFYCLLLSINREYSDNVCLYRMTYYSLFDHFFGLVGQVDPDFFRQLLLWADDVGG